MKSISHTVKFCAMGLLASSILMSANVAAHHGVNGQFDTSQDFEVTGVMTNIRMVNPHSYMYFDETTADGTVNNWQCELLAGINLKRRGWTDEMFAAGKKVTVKASPAWTGNNVCYVHLITFDDGTVLHREPDTETQTDVVTAPWAVRFNGKPHLAGMWVNDSSNDQRRAPGGPGGNPAGGPGGGMGAGGGWRRHGWKAYLSTTGAGGVNAKDRIGSGPWYNSRGELIAANIDALLEADGLSKTTSIGERSEIISGRGDEINRHDVLTGTQADGTALNNGSDTTCSNWTSNGEGSALVGHHDRTGGGDDPTSWTHAHGSRGCSQENLQASGGDGLFYCFAIDFDAPGVRAESGGMGEGASSRPTETSAPAAPGASQGIDASREGGGLTWLWALIGALILAGLTVLATRKKPG